MQTQLSSQFKETALGEEAEAILRKCVHCGFCLPACPTYQLLGDELDSPRGRIYLIKQVLEGDEPGPATQRHLDRCLTCRSCESACPSGVQYGRLVDIGRRLVEERVTRAPIQAAQRWLLREGLTSPAFAAGVRAAKLVRPWLPAPLSAKLPQAASEARSFADRRKPVANATRRVLLLAGCVQPALLPGLYAASARVLNAAGLGVVTPAAAGCCGAIREHLADHEGALRNLRRNIDAWWPAIEGSDGGPAVEAVISDASGCAVTLKEYGHMLAHDAAYARKAAAVASLARDISEVVALELPALRKALQAASGGCRAALQVPCTLQHGLRRPQILQRIMSELGFDVAAPAAEGHLCCGSAGTYSVLQPALADRLRERKLVHLRALKRECIVSANVGCILHLQAATHLPVRHWIELVAEALDARSQKT
jgi:glycolate oxidase iron-sulfur subunit